MHFLSFCAQLYLERKRLQRGGRLREDFYRNRSLLHVQWRKESKNGIRAGVQYWTESGTQRGTI